MRLLQPALSTVIIALSARGLNSEETSQEDSLPSDTDSSDSDTTYTDEDFSWDSTGLFYDKYLQRVMQLLEDDGGLDLEEILAKYSTEQIINGELIVNDDLVKRLALKTQQSLNTLKRVEMARVKKVLKAKRELDDKNEIQPGKLQTDLEEIANHLHYQNLKSFTAKDLDELLQAMHADMENFDQEKHDRYLEYELHEQAKYREHLENMSADDRTAHLEMEKVRKADHMARAREMNQPGSRKHLSEVWNTVDRMKGHDFNPHQFFMLHDKNNDRALDRGEIERLMDNELSKRYPRYKSAEDVNAASVTAPNAKEFKDAQKLNHMRRNEEKRRMRQHFFGNVDTNKDNVISIDELVAFTKSETFEREAGTEGAFKTLDEALEEGRIFTEEDLKKYMDMIKLEESKIRQRVEVFHKQNNDIAHEEKKIKAGRDRLGDAIQVDDLTVGFLDKKEQGLSDQRIRAAALKKDVDKMIEVIEKHKRNFREKAEEVKHREL